MTAAILILAVLLELAVIAIASHQPRTYQGQRNAWPTGRRGAP